MVRHGVHAKTDFLTRPQPFDEGTPRDLRIAVLLPCYNEAPTIAKVVSQFRSALPDASIYVYDNNSTDSSAADAREANAIVRLEPRQGKGFVVRRMFADIEADVYVMCDADDTYDVRAAPMLIANLVARGLDMVVGARSALNAQAYRPGHAVGNRLLSVLVRRIFGDEFRDMLSGYRVFSRRFVKSFPVMSSGFEIETELTIHALELQMPTIEIETAFSERPEGSMSKLRTVSDGCRILFTIATLLKQERPLLLFTVLAAILAGMAGLLAYPLLSTYVTTGLVPRFPTAILSTGLMVLAFLSLFSGLILETVTRGRQEAKRMRYLALAGIHATQDYADRNAA